MDQDYEDPMGPPPPWLHLLDTMQRAWRDKQIGKGRDPDSYIEGQLREAGVWPPKGAEDA